MGGDVFISSILLKPEKEAYLSDYQHTLKFCRRGKGAHLTVLEKAGLIKENFCAV